jgi:DNA-binding response OmpR family regulator
MSRGTILLADDEPTFLQSAAVLLRDLGFDVETAPDGDGALAAFERRDFDLLVSDLEMPGNADLALVRTITSRHGGFPVIILTGYPSVRSAMACIDLPVAAYLTKPVDIEELAERADRAITRFRAYTAMKRSEERMRQWHDDFAQLREAAPAGTGADVFLSLALRNVMSTLTDVEQVGRALAQHERPGHACQVLNCPRGLQLRDALTETVRVLEETKHAFRSKALGDLRRKLELLLVHN